MRFFYIKQISFEKGIVSDLSFDFGDQSYAFSVCSGRDLLTSNVYLSPESIINKIASYIEKDFVGILEMRAFNKDVVESKNMIHAKIIGVHDLYGPSDSTMWIEDFSSLISSGEKTVIKIANIGGFGGSLESGIVASSVFARSVFLLQNLVPDLRVDTFIDSSDGFAFEVQKSAFPDSLVQPLPISLDHINMYDAIFISDHDFAKKIKSERKTDNFHDIYSKMYGIKEIASKAINLLTVSDENECNVVSEMAKISKGRKSIFIPQFSNGQNSCINVVDLIGKNFPEYVIFTDFNFDEKHDVEFFNLHSILKGSFQKVCAAIKNVNLIVSEPMFVVDIAQAFFKPVLVLDNKNTWVGEYRYYNHVELVGGFDDSFSLDSMDEFNASCDSMKKYLKPLFSKESENFEDPGNNLDLKRLERRKVFIWSVLTILILSPFLMYLL